MRLNWKYCLAPALTCALAIPGAAVAQTTGEQQPEMQQQQPQQKREPQHDRQKQTSVIRADQLIGEAIRNQQNDRVGRIDDLGLQLQDGKIAYVVVNRGGAWGIGGETVALPWNQVKPDTTARAIRISDQELQQARNFDTARNWPAEIGQEAQEAVGTSGTVASADRRVVPMSNVIGMDVRNKQGENLGEIDDVAIGRDGSISYAVIAHGGFLGAGDSYIAVPWDRLSIDAQREEVTLDVTEQQLQGARDFDYQGNWPANVDWPFSGNR